MEVKATLMRIEGKPSLNRTRPVRTRPVAAAAIRWLALTLVAPLLPLTILAPSIAMAQSTFHVKEFDFKAGNWVFETVNANQSGFGPRTDRVQWGHELGLAYAVSDFWLPKLLISFDKDEGGRYDVQRVLFENIFTFKPLVEGRDGFGFAWFQSLEGAVNNRQTNSTAFGPIFTGQLGKFSMSTNTFFEKTFGQNNEPGMNFLLAWQARYEVMDKVKLGLEGYTLVPEIGARRSTPETGVANRIGPVLILELDLPRGMGIGGAGVSGGTGTVKHASAGGHGGHADAPHAEIEMGVLFGTTEYTPDVTGKVNMHIHF